MPMERTVAKARTAFQNMADVNSPLVFAPVHPRAATLEGSRVAGVCPCPSSFILVEFKGYRVQPGMRKPPLGRATTSSRESLEGVWSPYYRALTCVYRPMNDEGGELPQGKPGAVATVARNVALWRKRRGLTLEQLAASSGVPTVMLVAIEGGQHDPGIDLLDGLAKALAVRLVELFRDEEQEFVGLLSVDKSNDI